MTRASSIKPDPAKAQTTFFKDEFPVIRRALISFLLCVVLGAAAIGLSMYVRDQWQTNLNQAQSQRNAMRQKVSEAETEQRDIADFQAKFERLRGRGLIGEERRLDWVEAIGRIHEKRRLLTLSYDFSGQKVFTVDPTVSMGDIELRGTKMTLHMELLHELDLLRFLADLNGTSLQVVQKCKLARPAGQQTAPLAPRLSADCTLYWVTMVDRTDTAKNGH